MTGLRKAELEWLTWQDIDLDACTIRVASKPGWEPKTWEERTIEIPEQLVGILRGLPTKHKWVFANGAGGRYTHMWDDCAAIAKKAKVAGAHPHKFRAHYATTILQNGVDLKTVQKLLGHKDIASTMRYLAKAQSHHVRAKLDTIFNGK